jgi:DNA-directed RNA polymerase specialized sigma24 family protein
MTAVEAAAVLGVSANTVSTHIQRGLVSLRGEIGPECKEPVSCPG